jgi:hypothetical protein
VGGAHDGREHFLRDGGEETAEHRLIADVPRRVFRIGHLAGDPVIAGGDDLLDEGRRGLSGAGDVAKEMGMVADVGDHLGSP